MTKHKQLVTQMYADVITIDPVGARFACSGVDKNGIDRLGPALPEQKREWKAARRALQKQSNKEIAVTYLFFGVVFAVFMVGRLSMGGNPIEDTQVVLKFIAGLVK